MDAAKLCRELSELRALFETDALLAVKRKSDKGLESVAVEHMPGFKLRSGRLVLYPHVFAKELLYRPEQFGDQLPEIVTEFLAAIKKQKKAA